MLIKALKTVVLAAALAMVSSYPADAQAPRNIQREVIDARVSNAAPSTTLMVATGTGPITPSGGSIIIDVTGGTALTVNNVVTTSYQAGDTIKVEAASGDAITFNDGVGNIQTDTGSAVTIDGDKIGFIHVTASGVKVSLGGASGGWTVDRLDEVLFTAGANTFTISASGTTITFSSGNPVAEHQLITIAGTGTASDGRVMIVTGLPSPGVATLASWQGGPVFVDGGPYSTGQTVTHVRYRLYSTLFDEADDNFPKFRISDYFSRNKVELFSPIITDPGDTVEVGLRTTSGDKKTPSIRSAPWPGAYIYANAWDGVSFDGTYPHSKRHAQIAFPLVSGPTPTDHGGAMVFQTAREGSITSLDRFGIVSDGGIWAWGGATAEDNPSFDTGAEIDAHTETAADRVNAPSGYHSWLLDKVSPARFNIPAPRDAAKMALGFYEVASSAADGFGFNLEYADTQFQFMARNASVNQQLGRVNYANGAWDLGFAVNGSTNYGFRIQPVNSAVNAWEFRPSITGNRLLSIASGTDANVGFEFQPKGTGQFFITNSDAGAVGSELFLNHSTGSPAIGDKVGTIWFRGKDSGGTDTPAYGAITAVTTNVTNGGTEAGKFEIYTRTADNNTLKMTIEGGVYLGAPTGGDKGLGTLNAVGVYDDNTLLTDYVFDKLAGVEGVYSERVKAKYDALDAAMFEPEAYAAYWRENGRLYGMPDLSDVIDDSGVVDVSIGEMTQRLWQTVELQAIHTDQINDRLTALEGDYSKTKKRMAELFCLLADNGMEACAAQ